MYGNFCNSISFLSFAPLMTESEDIKSRIWQKAHELFIQYGIRSVSMDEIAAVLGMSKKTIYIHFKDKNAIVEEAINNVIKNSRDCIIYEKEISENAIEEALKGVDAFDSVLSRINPSLIFDMQKYHPNVYLLFAKYKNEFIYEMVKANMERGIDEGIYRKDIDIEVLSKLRVENVWIPFNPEYYTQFEISISQIQKEIFLHFLYGIVSENGYSILNNYKNQRLNKLSNENI